MKRSIFLNCLFQLIFLFLLFGNFTALAQNTNIWIVNHAEADSITTNLTLFGQQRAIDLVKSLKHDHIEVIYVADKKSSLQTANPLGIRNKILPRIYTDSVQKFAEIIKQNFIGKNVLIIANYDTIIPFISSFGAESPFDALDKEDYDQLFSITISSSGAVELSVGYYGKKHHINAIPQSYIIDNFSPGIPGR
jgi:2,3-bisphosphoglycerate-dependent phosphoglycerate mutase